MLTPIFLASKTADWPTCHLLLKGHQASAVVSQVGEELVWGFLWRHYLKKQVCKDVSTLLSSEFNCRTKLHIMAGKHLNH